MRYTIIVYVRGLIEHLPEGRLKDFFARWAKGEATSQEVATIGLNVDNLCSRELSPKHSYLDEPVRAAIVAIQALDQGEPALERLKTSIEGIKARTG